MSETCDRCGPEVRAVYRVSWHNQLYLMPRPRGDQRPLPEARRPAVAGHPGGGAGFFNLIRIYPTRGSASRRNWLNVNPGNLLHESGHPVDPVLDLSNPGSSWLPPCCSPSPPTWCGGQTSPDPPCPSAATASAQPALWTPQPSRLPGDRRPGRVPAPDRTVNGTATPGRRDSRPGRFPGHKNGSASKETP
jgi:hypothetical protein